MKITLHRFLTLTGFFDNKQDIVFAIKNKEIKIDDKIILNPKYQFNPNSKKVFWKEKELNHDSKKYYLIFNKPEGYISEKILNDSEKKSIFDIINIDKKILNQLSAIGRLDEDSSGMIILTNDGKVNHRIAQPDSEIKKTYEVELEKEVSEKDIKKIESGIIIDMEVNGEHSDYKTKPVELKTISKNKLQVTITEGKKREVKRIFDAVSNKVINLKRVSIGNLRLDNLEIKKGEFVFVDRDLIDEKVLKIG